jgi:DNA-directed RNA polymerase subunit omega
MKQAPIDELLKQCSSIYKLVVIAAKRAKELSEGGQKLVESDLKKVTSLALEEIRQGKVVCEAQDEAEEKGPRKKERKEKEHAGAGSKKKS